MHRYADEGEGGVAGRGARSAGLKPLSSLTIVRKQKLYSHKTRSLRTIGRKIKGPLWGTDVMVMVAEPRARDQLAVWADRIEEAMHEAKLVDGYKMQVALDGEEEDPSHPPLPSPSLPILAWLHPLPTAPCR